MNWRAALACGVGVLFGLVSACVVSERVPFTPEITTTSLPDATVNEPYSVTLTGYGGYPPYTWSTRGVPTQLDWLVLDSATGTLSGTPVGFADAQSFVAIVTDGRSQTATKVLTLAVTRCTAEQEYPCFAASNGQCFQNTLVCSPEGRSGTCSTSGANPSSDVAYCGAGCLACSANADRCKEGICVCGEGAAPCSGSAPTCCSATCADTSSDVHHCGTCGNGCPEYANSTAACRNSQCTYDCHEDYISCLDGCCPKAVGLSLGSDHSCALLKDQTVKCWGRNNVGQLGNNDPTGSNRNVPVAVVDSSNNPLTGFTAMAAGTQHTCAITGGGGVQCWGYNGFGQLGSNDPTGSNQNVPVTVVGPSGSGSLSGATAIAAGWLHTCAITGGGGVQCWGYNGFGQLGNDPTGSNRNVPVTVVGPSGSGSLSGATAIAAGWLHTCAITSGDSVQCWGYNGFGQLGNGNIMDRSSLPVSSLSGANAIATGRYHTCAITGGGGVQCWGYNGFGQLGNNDPTGSNRNVPVTVVGPSGSGSLSGATAIAAGWAYTCAITGGGEVQCWGNNKCGQLGNNDPTGSNRNVPVTVVGPSGSGSLSGATAIAAGWAHTCTITNGGGVKCWGNNKCGQLGNGSNDPSATPVDVRF